jgi:Icc protein
MPGILYQPIRRRQFISCTAKGVAAWALTLQLPKGAEARPDHSLHIALFSDTHVAADPKSENRKFVPWENLKLAVAQAQERTPELVLLNGDAARLTGELDDYQAVKALLAPLAAHCPIFLGLGNHDHRENFLKVFVPPPEFAQKVADKHVLVLERPQLRFIILDSLFYVNKSSGLLGKTQRTWLDKYLASCDGRVTILFVHHTLGDGDGELLDAPALFRIVEPYAKVKAIFYGHSHEYAYAEHRGLHLVNLPAVGYNFADKEPVGWVDAWFSPEGVDLTLKANGGNRAQDGKTTSLAWRHS